MRLKPESQRGDTSWMLQVCSDFPVSVQNNNSYYPNIAWFLHQLSVTTVSMQQKPDNTRQMMCETLKGQKN